MFAFVFLLTLLISLFAATTVLADHGDPVGSCPRGFKLEHFMDHTDHMHMHIGVPRDTNGDGYICMRHISDELHLHVNNYLPLN